MHALFSRRFIVSSSSQLTKSLMKKKKLAFSHWSQSRYILSHLLPSGLASSSSVTRVGPSLVLRSEKINRFFVSTLRRSLLETRAGFFDPQLPPKPWVFTGFQKRGWKSWFNGANGVVFGLIIANAAVFTMWKVYDRKWMFKNFVLSLKSFMTGRIHTLITSGFTNVGTSQLIMNMIGLYYFGTRIATTLGPVYLLKLYFAGSLAGSLLFLSAHAVMAILKSQGVSYKGQSKPIGLLGPEGSVYAIALLDMCLYPKVTTYFAFICRVPVILSFENKVLKVLDGEQKRITVGMIHAVGGAMVATESCKDTWRIEMGSDELGDRLYLITIQFTDYFDNARKRTTTDATVEQAVKERDEKEPERKSVEKVFEDVLAKIKKKKVWFSPAELVGGLLVSSLANTSQADSLASEPQQGTQGETNSESAPPASKKPKGSESQPDTAQVEKSVI
ncbi:PREDICTED: rhomboid-like protein 16, chloroplastic [Brassica oleracea var. oleracea]|uniref:rhomboid-like protein 16, chloroplastic n=1 Tax=Brassica oleracea var. oleracea TaxID=109376 RepID=UPI0006A6FFAC|nr:PREDICTED: rhomboid-like protein 16, chloroplastic [Brassica oleracea var. oleracea]